MGWSRGEQDTVLGVLRRAVEADPDAVFLDFGGDLTSYGQLYRRAMRLANGLRAHGVAPGDRVVTLMDNHVDAVAAWFGINAAGAISVPVNTAYKGEFLRHQIDDAGPRLVIAEPDYAGRVEDVAGDLRERPPVFLRDATLGGLYVDDDRDPGRQPDPGDLTMLIYTAGTTGPSKGCMISHNYACNLARQSNDLATRRPGETVWTPQPLFHLNATATGVLTSALLNSAISVFPRFSVSRFWGDVERSGARMVSLLGSAISLIALAPETPETLRCRGQLRIAYGAPFPGEMARIWRERFGVERAGAPGYGLSEASMIVTAPLRPDPVPDASGKRNEDFDVRIVDDRDEELPPGEVGEIICRPLRPHVMFSGYWKRPEATLGILRNLWLHTGDLGKFDADGNFYFVDRKKDYLRRRGENISSYELEATFLRHPDLVEVAVHAVPSEVSEDDVKVTAVRTPGSALSERELCLWAVERVPYFAVPRYVEFREQLPKNPVGRVLKYQLREDGRTAGTWDREESDVQLTKR
ncbi:ATP-dependent acyl-CoA ligase [Pseudonocardia eucalypti]|uniref:ATP-dependent acyl-CoA ligase n=1 Tax=Pseudonocardia eucalypti TaxID=648755 RepID=A0ABP9PWS2_9PSEU|nr:crotonobetaine/carnitine-CoA ligase [Pseudonocardia eucalypti]